jgi:hypothetical protein
MPTRHNASQTARPSLQRRGRKPIDAPGHHAGRNFFLQTHRRLQININILDGQFLKMYINVRTSNLEEIYFTLEFKL